MHCLLGSVWHDFCRKKWKDGIKSLKYLLLCLLLNFQKIWICKLFLISQVHWLDIKGLLLYGKVYSLCMHTGASVSTSHLSMLNIGLWFASKLFWFVKLLACLLKSDFKKENVHFWLWKWPYSVSAHIVHHSTHTDHTSDSWNIKQSTFLMEADLKFV